MFSSAYLLPDAGHLSLRGVGNAIQVRFMWVVEVEPGGAQGQANDEGDRRQEKPSGAYGWQAERLAGGV